MAKIPSSPHEGGFEGEATGSGLRNPSPGLATSAQEARWVRHPLTLVGLTGRLCPRDTGHVQRHVWMLPLGDEALLLASDRRPCPTDDRAQGGPSAASPSPRRQWSQSREALSQPGGRQRGRRPAEHSAGNSTGPMSECLQPTGASREGRAETRRGGPEWLCADTPGTSPSKGALRELHRGNV